MEGRTHPAVAIDANDPLVPPKSPSPPPTPLVSERSETYIVRIPRDQIYRVPPPENSKIVESYRTLPGKQKQGCKCGWLFWAVILILLFAIGCVITLGIFHALYKPIAPTFSITSVHVKNSTTARSSHTNPSYEISLKVENPNARMGISYEDGGISSISYREKIIGEGKYPIASSNAMESTNIQLTLAGLKTALPSEVEKSMKDQEAKTPVKLSLAISVPIKFKGKISFTKSLKVTCDFKANTLAMGTKISSQNCNSEVKA